MAASARRVSDMNVRQAGMSGMPSKSRTRIGHGNGFEEDPFQKVW